VTNAIFFSSEDVKEIPVSWRQKFWCFVLFRWLAWAVRRQIPVSYGVSSQSAESFLTFRRLMTYIYVVPHR